MEIKLRKNKLSNIATIIINLLFIYIIYIGINTSFFMHNVNRPLWVDEGYLVKSFALRNFTELFTLGEFEYMQSAPLVWLYLNKIITMFFGYGEHILRVVSLVSYLLTIGLIIFIQKSFYKSKFPFIGAAIFANLDYALYYSNMFKQYEFDGFIALIIISCYIFYISKKISFKTLILLWMPLIWCSQIASFVEGGLLLSEFIFSVIRKDKADILHIIIAGFFILISFTIYYFIWANRMTSVKGMQSVWGWAFFPLIPKNMDDVNKAISLALNQIFRHFTYVYETLTLFLLGLVYVIFKKDKVLIGIYLGFFLTLLASYLQFYPLRDRTCFFVFPLMILIFSVFLEDIIKNNIITKITALSTIVYMLFFFNCDARNSYHRINNVHIIGDEVDLQVKYLNKRIRPDEMVYVYSQSVPIFEYKNGLGNLHIGKSGKNNNIIFGKGFFNNEVNLNILGNYKTELKKVLSYPKIYISASNITNKRGHPFFNRIENLIDELNQNGYLELVQYEYESPLWYFSKDSNKCKTRYQIKELNSIRKLGMVRQIIRIENTGKAYLNDPYNQTYLVDTTNNSIYPLNKLVAPKNSIDIEVIFPEETPPKFILKKQYGKICTKSSKNAKKFL